MKNPTIFADGEAKQFTKSKIMKKINCPTNVQNFSQKTANSCGYLFFLTTFAKRLKIKELWQKSKRQRLVTLCLTIKISTNTPSTVCRLSRKASATMVLVALS